MCDYLGRHLWKVSSMLSPKVRNICCIRNRQGHNSDPGNREANDRSLPLFPSKSNPPVSSLALQQTTCWGLPTHTSLLCTPYKSNLPPYSWLYLSPQHQQAVKSPWETPGLFSLGSKLSLSLHVQSPSLMFRSLSGLLLWPHLTLSPVPGY